MVENYRGYEFVHLKDLLGLAYTQNIRLVRIDYDSTCVWQQVPADLLPALEEHLRDLESGKKTTGSGSAV